MFIEKNSEEWATLKENLAISAFKSNKDKLCTKCWRVYSYKMAKKHNQTHPAHEWNLMCPRDFANEEAFVYLASEMGKVKKNDSGKIYAFQNPFADTGRQRQARFNIWRRQREGETLSSSEELEEDSEEKTSEVQT